VPLDVTAPLPEHFARGMEQLGFDEADGAEIPELRGEDTREDKKRAAKAHAKQFRKERRGERRSRGDGPAKSAPVKFGKGSTKPDAKKAPSTKPSTKKAGPDSRPMSKGPKVAGKSTPRSAGVPGRKPSGRPAAPRSKA